MPQDRTEMGWDDRPGVIWHSDTSQRRYDAYKSILTFSAPVIEFMAWEDKHAAVSETVSCETFGHSEGV